MIGLQISMYVQLFILPVITLIVGIISKKNPPKEINGFRGYRTALSKSSQEAWDYANMRSAQIMIKGSLIALAIGAVVLAVYLIAKLSPLSAVFGAVVVTVMMVQLIIIIIPNRLIEKELRDEVYKK